MKEHEEDWKELCRLVSVERDPDKLMQLVRQINDLFEAKEKRLSPSNEPLPSKSNTVFQIAYDEMLLVERAALLRDRGCEVRSAIGNEGAKRILDKSRRYRLFIVGHAASTEIREEMVRWLKANFPGTTILVLNPPFHPNLPEADYNFVFNGPEEWLPVVQNTAA